MKKSFTCILSICKKLSIETPRKLMEWAARKKGIPEKNGEGGGEPLSRRENESQSGNKVFKWISSKSWCAPRVSVITRVAESWGVGFLTTLGVGVGLYCSIPTPDARLDHFKHHTRKLGIPVEMVQFRLKLSLTERFIAVYHDFHWF